MFLTIMCLATPDKIGAPRPHRVYKMCRTLVSSPSLPHEGYPEARTAPKEFSLEPSKVQNAWQSYFILVQDLSLALLYQLQIGRGLIFANLHTEPDSS